MPRRGERLEHLLQGGLHLGRALRQAELAVAVVAFEPRRRALFAPRSPRIARHPRRIHLLVQQAGSGKAVEQAVHGDLVHGHARGGQGGFHLGLGQHRVGPRFVKRRQRPRGAGGTHAGRQGSVGTLR